MAFFGVTGALAALSLLPFLLLGLAIPYTVLRLTNRPDDPDTQIGFKCAIFFAFSLGVLLMLTGLTVGLIDLLEARGDLGTHLGRFGEGLRIAAALVMAGFVIGFFHLILILGFSNVRKHPEARRVFVGWRLAIHTLVVLGAFTGLTVQLFQEYVEFDRLKPLLAVMAVWTPSWILHMVLLHTYRSTAPRTGLPGVRRDEDDED
jgi:hypothetical protein